MDRGLTLTRHRRRRVRPRAVWTGHGTAATVALFSQSAKRIAAMRGTVMSFGNIIDRLMGAANGGRDAPAGQGDRMNAGDDIKRKVRDFLGQEQVGGMSGAKIGGLGALAGAVLGGGLGGAARGGALAMVGAVALKAWREHQAQQGGAPVAEPTTEEIAAIAGPDVEQLALSAMIGAAQADGRIDPAEMERLLGRLGPDEATEAERQAVIDETRRPVDVEALGARVSRPEVATEIYLAALMAVTVETDAERAYFRRLAAALRLDQGVVARLHRMAGAPNPTA
jgi:uncharacterized membrane protein YebE (DUF533 family)